MKQEVMNKLIEKGNNKTKDGVYSYEGYPYAVINKRVRFVGDFNKIYEIAFGFCVIIWSSQEHWKTKTKIKELFKTVRNN